MAMLNNQLVIAYYIYISLSLSLTCPCACVYLHLPICTFVTISIYCVELAGAIHIRRFWMFSFHPYPGLGSSLQCKHQDLCRPCLVDQGLISALSYQYPARKHAVHGCTCCCGCWAWLFGWWNSVKPICSWNVRFLSNTQQSTTT